jgi:prepilin-type N-terminal cleavage/methylation domain-containing protein
VEPALENEGTTMRDNKRTVSVSKTGKSCDGFTLIEMMISMTVMAIGLLGLNVMFVTAMATNNKNSHDSSATMVSQLVLEQISAQPANSTATIAVTDCAGNVRTIATAPGAASTGAGSPLLADGTIDPLAAKVTNYSMTYVACAPAGSNLQSDYDVRWNVMTVSPDTRLITVSARQLNGTHLGALHFALPVNLRSIGGR